MGYILLEGGAEFGGRMADADERALEIAGGKSAPVRIIPAAAAPDNNERRAGSNAHNWFTGLGATDVSVVPVLDDASANSAQNVEALRNAKIVYMLGGFTHHLGQTMLNSESWQATLEAYQNGAVVAGSSAGAMVLCEYYFNPSAGKVERGLNLVPNACVLPHHNTFGKRWVDNLRGLLPNATLIGIDERTGMIDDTDIGHWTVYGGGEVTVYRADGVTESASHGETIGL